MTASVYTNAKSVRTKIREAIQYQIQQITIANGYKNTFSEVLFEIPTSQSRINYPSVTVLFGQEQIVNEDMSDNLWHKLLPVMFIVHLMDQADTVLYRETILQDLEYRFGNNFTIKDSAGVETCMIATLDTNEPFGMKINKPQIGITFGFSVRYRQSIIDPTVPG
jgi:hypothetical protein